MRVLNTNLRFLSDRFDPFMAVFSSFFSLICPVARDLVDNEEGAHSKHFKHWEAGYTVILPTKALKARMATTGRILGTNGLGHILGTNGVGHVGPIFVSGHST